MRFEYDRQKSESNLEKHGIDFDEVQAVWNDPDVYQVPVRRGPERRWAVLGRYGGDVWVVIVTYRDRGNPPVESTRIISARRATTAERRGYEQQAGR